MFLHCLKGKDNCLFVALVVEKTGVPEEYHQPSCRDCPSDSASCRGSRKEAESRWTVSVGSQFSRTEVSAGSKRSRTVSAEAKYDVKSAETVREFLLPAETSVHDNWLPAKTVRVNLLPAKRLDRKQNHADSLCRKPFIMYRSLGRKQELADSLGGSQI